MSRRIVWVAVLITAWAAWSTAGAQAQVRYIHTDALGSVVAVTNEQRVVIERREYEPYGHQLTPAVADGPGYTGHVQDAATGLTYMQQRYYDPQIGVFLSIDPVSALSDPAFQFHRYRYSNNSPFVFIDPDGRRAKHCLLLCGSIHHGFEEGTPFIKNSQESDFFDGDYVTRDTMSRYEEAFGSIFSDSSISEANREAIEKSSYAALLIPGSGGAIAALRVGMTTKNGREVLKTACLLGSLCSKDPSSAARAPNDAVVTSIRQSAETKRAAAIEAKRRSRQINNERPR